VPAFEEDVLVCQDPFHPNHRKELLSFLPPELAEKFENEWRQEEANGASPPPRERWDHLKHVLVQHEKVASSGLFFHHTDSSDRNRKEVTTSRPLVLLRK